MKSEADIIARLTRKIPSRIGVRASSDVPLGIGDDAAIVRTHRGSDLVVSTDAFLEGRHFLAEIHPPDHAGHKALARAVSDLAAMGSTPRYFLLTLALPARRAGRWLDSFARGMGRAARMFGMHLIGGDVARDDHVAAAITVIGEARAGRALTRGGGRAGDALYVTGRLGAAQAGLDQVRREGARAIARRGDSYSLHRHLYPEPRLAIGRMLALRGLATAAMDISDGLSIDLARLCAASRVGAVIHVTALPVYREERSGTPRPVRRGERVAQFVRALHGGEDYELLFAVPRRLASRVPANFHGVPITRIGELTRRRTILLETDGRTRRLRPLGWDHFARR